MGSKMSMHYYCHFVVLVVVEEEVMVEEVEGEEVGKVAVVGYCCCRSVQCWLQKQQTFLK